MTAPILLTLPYPPRALSPNTRKRWERIAASQSYRQLCFVEAKNIRLAAERSGYTFPLAQPATAVITFVLDTKRSPDLDNLLSSFKAGLDGIVLAGLLEDDNCRVLRLAIEATDGPVSEVRVSLQGAEP